MVFSLQVSDLLNNARPQWDQLNSGQDGWRAEIAKDFNFENVTRVGAAIADYAKQNHKGKPLLVGYDTRFLSKEFAERISQVAVGRNVKVLLIPEFASTPEISWAAREKKNRRSRRPDRQS